MRSLNLAWPLLALGAQALSTELQSQQVSVSLHRQPIAAAGAASALRNRLNSRSLAHSIRGGALKGWSDTEEESSSSEGAEEDSEIESDSTEHSDDKSSKGKKKGTASDKQEDSEEKSKKAVTPPAKKGFLKVVPSAKLLEVALKLAPIVVVTVLLLLVSKVIGVKGATELLPLFFGIFIMFQKSQKAGLMSGLLSDHKQHFQFELMNNEYEKDVKALAIANAKALGLAADRKRDAAIQAIKDSYNNSSSSSGSSSSKDAADASAEAAELKAVAKQLRAAEKSELLAEMFAHPRGGVLSWFKRKPSSSSSSSTSSSSNSSTSSRRSSSRSTSSCKRPHKKRRSKRSAARDSAESDTDATASSDSATADGARDSGDSATEAAASSAGAIADTAAAGATAAGSATGDATAATIEGDTESDTSTTEGGAVDSSANTTANAAVLKQEQRPRVFVVELTDKDVDDKYGAYIRDLVTFLCASADRPTDEIVIKLMSPGGPVHTYGLAAAHLERLKAKVARVTVCVDLVAASGGYMLAVVSHHIIAAPFSMVGSIGVRGGVLNLYRALKQYGVDSVLVTAGEHKAGLDMTNEITEANMAHQKENIEAIHVAFKDHIKKHRPAVDVDRVGTGEVWLASQAHHLGLVDELSTATEYIDACKERADVYKVSRYLDTSTMLFGPRSASAALTASVKRFKSTFARMDKLLKAAETAVGIVLPQTSAGGELSGVPHHEALQLRMDTSLSFL